MCFLPPPCPPRRPAASGPCFSPPFATSPSSFISLQPEGPIGCGDTITTTNITTNATTTNHTRNAENTRNIRRRTGRRRKGISAEEPGKRKHNPLLTPPLEPSPGKIEPREQQEGPEAPEPQAPSPIFCKKLLSPLSYTYSPLGRCNHVSEDPVLVRLDSGRISVEGSTIGKDHSLLHWFGLLLARLIARC